MTLLWVCDQRSNDLIWKLTLEGSSRNEYDMCTGPMKGLKCVQRVQRGCGCSDRRAEEAEEKRRSAEKCRDDRKEIGRKSTRYSESLIEIEE